MTDMNKSNIQRVVMGRVRTAYWLRRATSSTILAGAACAFAVLGLGHEVFVAQVIANMPAFTDVSAVARFFISALINTTYVVQLLVGVGVIAFVWLIADGLRNIRGLRSFAS